MRVAVVGAGVSGIVTARVLRAAGHDVVVFERAPDLGGVWSATRRYPGISTQDDRRTYAFSDLPMPAAVPEHPRGADVRAYLEHYAEVHRVRPLVRLGTDVVAVAPGESSRWDVTTRGPEGERTLPFDLVVVANGVFSASHVPDLPGRADFEAAGGVVRVPSDLADGAELADRAVLVLGWGKTACDVAAAAAALTDRVGVVARVLRWKHPKHLGGGLTFRHLLLTRAGEHLLAAPHRSLRGRLLARATRPLRRVLDAHLAARVAARLDLDRLGLRPDGPYADSNALVSDGFFEAVADGRLTVHRECTVLALGAEGGRPVARLSDGTVAPADVLVPATGYDQVLDLFVPAVRAALLDASGDLLLHRRTLPLAVDGVAFVGWTHTFHSPLSAEVQAVWLAAHLRGVLAPRRAGEPARYRLTHERAAAARAPQLPSATFGDLDVLLEDLGAPLPRRTWWRQLARPIDPADYAHLLPHVLAQEPAVPAARPDAVVRGAHRAPAVSPFSGTDGSSSTRLAR